MKVMMGLFRCDISSTFFFSFVGVEEQKSECNYTCLKPEDIVAEQTKAITKIAELFDVSFGIS